MTQHSGALLCISRPLLFVLLSAVTAGRSTFLPVLAVPKHPRPVHVRRRIPESLQRLPQVLSRRAGLHSEPRASGRPCFLHTDACPDHLRLHLGARQRCGLRCRPAQGIWALQQHRHHFFVRYCVRLGATLGCQAVPCLTIVRSRQWCASRWRGRGPQGRNPSRLDCQELSSEGLEIPNLGRWREGAWICALTVADPVGAGHSEVGLALITRTPALTANAVANSTMLLTGCRPSCPWRVAAPHRINPWMDLTFGHRCPRGHPHHAQNCCTM